MLRSLRRFADGAGNALVVVAREAHDAFLVDDDKERGRHLGVGHRSEATPERLGCRRRADMISAVETARRLGSTIGRFGFRPNALGAQTERRRRFGGHESLWSQIDEPSSRHSAECARRSPLERPIAGVCARGSQGSTGNTTS